MNIWSQFRVIAWAQWRTTRNHLPRTGLGGILIGLISSLWYVLYLALGITLAVFLPRAPVTTLHEWLPVGLLGVFLFWQLIPLFTLSSGWSLQLNKLQIYPIADRALFLLEVMLRLTSAPEMLLVLMGGIIGLLGHPGVPFGSGLLLFLYIPFNLLLSLAIRELILHAFQRNRFRELFAILIISIAVIPQLLLRSGLGPKSTPYLLAVARSTATPWHETSSLVLGLRPLQNMVLLLVWTLATYYLARRQFQKALLQEENLRVAGTGSAALDRERAGSRRLIGIPNRLFRDPMAALLQKEFHSLLRMPRFRVLFGMACVFSVVIFIPMTLRADGRAGHSFVTQNFLPIVTLYGLLLLSDTLLLNVFGFDRSAAQLYFVTPVHLATVLKAKNLTAIAFIVAQNLIVLIFAALIRGGSISALNVCSALGASAVVSLFFVVVGNLSSVAMPRPIDPTQTFRKQAGGKMQLWFLACSVGMFLLVGFAFLAQWAFRSAWGLGGVLLVEFLVGLITYRIAMDSAVERGLRNRERIIETLSRGPSPVGIS